MLKNKFKILTCIFIFAILFTTFCFATDDTSAINDENSVDATTQENHEELEETSNWVNDDLYLSGNDIVIEGVVDGNVFAIGGNVTINAQIGGDLFVIAENLTLENGYIYGSIFSISTDMKINGIACDIYAINDNFTLESNGKILRDLKLISKNVIINGLVGRNAYINSTNIAFSEVANTYIYGNLNYISNQEISIPEGAVKGSVDYSKSTENTSSVTSYIVTILTSIGLLLLNTFVVSILAIKFTPNFVKKVYSMGLKKTLISLPIGLAALILIPIVAILALLTVVGIPLACALLAIYFLLIAFATTFASIAISAIITKKYESKIKFILFSLISTIAIFVLSLIPFVGGIVEFLVLILGLGTVVFNLFRKLPKKEIIAE